MDSAVEEFDRGTALAKEGLLSQAIPLLERAVAQDPWNGSYHHNLATALRAFGNRTGALEHARKAAGLPPSHSSSMVLCGALELLFARVENARSWFRTALQKNPDSYLAHYHLGIVLLVSGEKEAGISHLESAVRVGRACAPVFVLERILGQLEQAKNTRSSSTEFALCNVPMISEYFAPTSTPSKSLPFEGAGVTDTPCSPEEVAALLRGKKKIVALTGAGISRGSGLRTRKELWMSHNRDDAVSIWRFLENPATLWQVVADFLGSEEALPNPAHRALAQLPGLSAIITQNVDGLHQVSSWQAGGPEVPILELHGTLLKTKCHECGGCFEKTAKELLAVAEKLPPRCTLCGGAMRPAVVLFGESVAPDTLAEAGRWVGECDALLVVGCAMDVAPAAELPRIAASRGAVVIECKRTPSRISSAVGCVRLSGVAEETLPRLVGCLS